MSVVVELKARKAKHQVDVVRHNDDMFGVTFQPICRYGGDDQCYRGPFVSSERRAFEIGLEHSRKGAGSWKPAF